MRGKGLVGTRIKLTTNLIDEIPEHCHRLIKSKKAQMNMRELLLGTVVIVGLFSSAHANDKEVVGDVAMEDSDGTFAISPSTRKRAANYHNDQLKKTRSLPRCLLTSRPRQTPQTWR